MKQSKLVVKELEILFGPDFNIKLEEFVKENGIKKLAYIICKQDQTAAPIFYDDQFEELNPQKKAQLIHKLYYEYCPKHMLHFDINTLCDFNFYKDKIKCMLLNKELNQEMLEQYPYIEFLDLVAMFYIDLTEEDQEYKIKINYSILDLWKIDVDTLYENAKMNIKDSLSLKHVSEMLKDNNVPDLPMYIYSCNHNYYGATSILFLKELEKFASIFQSDIYILPSSVHEVILIPAKDRIYQLHDFEEEKEHLNWMVKTTNESHVKDDEILSDHIYVYLLNDKKIIIP